MGMSSDREREGERRQRDDRGGEDGKMKREEK